MRDLPPLVLASTSRHRRALLERLRVPFELHAPDWNEVRLATPGETVLENARGKGRAGARRRPDAAILASDQVAWCEGRMLEKPGTPERACEQLAWLAGREHELYTCVLLRMPDGAEASETIVAHLRLRALSPDQIVSYVRLETPLDCAGSYMSEALGIVLFEHIRCDDPTAIVGLPLIAVRRLLERAGWDLLRVPAP